MNISILDKQTINKNIEKYYYDITLFVSEQIIEQSKYGNLNLRFKNFAHFLNEFYKSKYNLEPKHYNFDDTIYFLEYALKKYNIFLEAYNDESYITFHCKLVYCQ